MSQRDRQSDFVGHADAIIVKPASRIEALGWLLSVEKYKIRDAIQCAPHLFSRRDLFRIVRLKRCAGDRFVLYFRKHRTMMAETDSIPKDLGLSVEESKNREQIVSSLRSIFQFIYKDSVTIYCLALATVLVSILRLSLVFLEDVFRREPTSSRLVEMCHTNCLQQVHMAFGYWQLFLFCAAFGLYPFLHRKFVPIPEDYVWKQKTARAETVMLQLLAILVFCIDFLPMIALRWSSFLDTNKVVLSAVKLLLA